MLDESIDDVLQFSTKFHENQSRDKAQCSANNVKALIFIQTQLKDVVGDLGLIKDKAKLLGSRLNEEYIFWNLYLLV